MAIIVNGVDIPTSGNNIKYGNTDITKVNVVKNGITTTVWERILFTTKEFNYTGGMQSVTVPAGLYKLEVWGAQGGGWIGDYADIGGAGGYSCRYYYFSTETTLYVCVGGKGGVQYANNTPVPGGYNGGGLAWTYWHAYSLEHGTGGGCTHIATRTGVLSSLASYKSSVLVVAGGGGGGGVCTGDNGTVLVYKNGGAGGGLSGGDGVPMTSLNQSNQQGYGGTQTSGGVSGNCNIGDVDYDGVPGHTVQHVNGSFGQGGYCNYSCFAGGSGGGGYYGGGSGTNYNGACPGGGGSGYIGVSSIIHNGVTYTNTSIAGQRFGNGMAKITFIS